MKRKITIILLMITLLFVPRVKASTNEKVNVYLFWGSYCSHCHHFIKYMTDNYDLYKDYAEVITYQIDGYEDNALLMEEVSKNFDDVNGYIPLIIVGDDFHQEGFGQDGTNIINAIKAAYEDNDYKDLVKKAIDSSKNKGIAKTLKEASEVISGKEDNNSKEDNSNSALKEEESNRASIAEIKGNNHKSFEITPKLILVVSIGATLLATGLILVIKHYQKKEDK